MNDLDDFFDSNKPLKKVQLPGRNVGCKLKFDDRVIKTKCVASKVDSVDYATDYKLKELEFAMESSANPPQESSITVPEGHDDAKLNVLKESIYNKYNFTNFCVGKKPLMSDYNDKIIQALEESPVVIIQGPTGCGKTTQIPQIIMDYHRRKNEYCKIAVTQPRKIAAISIAKRVCDERGWPLGSVVGYQVGLKRKLQDETIITYMTTGVLLQQIVSKKTLHPYTHIVIDEVHERDADMDFLLLVVRRFLRTESSNVKVLIMSATLNVANFSEYFQYPKEDKLKYPVLIDVTQTKQHNTSVYFLDDFKGLFNEPVPEFDINEPEFKPSLLRIILKLLKAYNNFDGSEPWGAVLIFLPGYYEILTVYEFLESQNSDPVKWHIIPLHSSITVDEQRQVFEPSPAGHRKIILSTNIAESSLTIPDIIYVIDLCLTKVVHADPVTDYCSLKLSWASHANCIQRAGRVGRVAIGRIYRLVTTQFYKKMRVELIPEMLRTPLHKLVLLAKMLDFKIPPHGILALAIDSPPLHKIQQTILTLKEAGGLLTTVNEKYNVHDGDLTYLGRIMAALPIDIYATKLIVLGYLFSILNECVIMAAGMTVQNIFSVPFKGKLKSYQSKLSWADCSFSDLLAYLHVYNVWRRNKSNSMYQMNSSEINWMKRNYLQPRVMNEWHELVEDIKKRLDDINIIAFSRTQTSTLTSVEKTMLLKIAIAGAFYPNYFIRTNQEENKDEINAVRELGGRDPNTTVYFSGNKDGQPIELYSKYIREHLRECGTDMTISYDNSNKVFVQFKPDVIKNSNFLGKRNPLVPGKIAVEVYNAVKQRHVLGFLPIKCHKKNESVAIVNEYKSKKQETSEEVIYESVIPGYETSFIEICISHTNNPGQFFIHNVENMTIMQILESLQMKLKSIPNNTPTEVLIGKLYAAPYYDKLYRIKVLDIIANEAKVYYIDYGNIKKIPLSQLRNLTEDIIKMPPLAIECTLTKIKPTQLGGLWTEEATTEFSNLIHEKTLFGKIYSVVDNIVSLELFCNSTLEKSVNEILIEKKFAEEANESYLSQENHKLREFYQNNSVSNSAYVSKFINIEASDDLPIPIGCKYTMELRGPFSPLEAKVHGVLQCNFDKQILIDANSVNSVLLNSDMQDTYDRLLVAGSVSQNVDSLTIRQTTIMPNIHGFPVLMALLFAIDAEFHTSSNNAKFTSILCGLGYDKVTNESYFPAHDLVFIMDFEFTEEMLTLINEIRFYLNKGLQFTSNASSMTDNGYIVNCRQEIIKASRILLNIRPKPQERIIQHNIYDWGLSSKLTHNNNLLTASDFIWKPYPLMKLAEDIPEPPKLGLYSKKKKPDNTLCRICKISLETASKLRVHLLEHLHNGDL